jgi:transposase-like protein
VLESVKNPFRPWPFLLHDRRARGRIPTIRRRIFHLFCTETQAILFYIVRTQLFPLSPNGRAVVESGGDKRPIAYEVPPVRRLCWPNAGGGSLLEAPPLSPAVSPLLSPATYPSLRSERPIVPRPREGHRRRFSEADKQWILEEVARPGASAAEVAAPGIRTPSGRVWRHAGDTFCGRSIPGVELPEPRVKQEGNLRRSSEVKSDLAVHPHSPPTQNSMLQ